MWAHVVERARAEGGAWSVACAGLALPALTSIAARLSARFAADPADIHSGVLTGFLAELAEIDLIRPLIMNRLRWAAYRGGHRVLREALDAPSPALDDGTAPLSSRQVSEAAGHPDLVLARAVAEDVITSGEAELIAATRLERKPLADVAQERGIGYEALKKCRRRVEHRLAAYLREEAAGDSTTRCGPLMSPKGRGTGVQRRGRCTPTAPSAVTSEMPPC
ncbi:hypothetical protein GCM10009533_42900 [Saccharopolyspora spinosporotrichia]|uniref:Sigma-70 family RNA polymerase sigma factor n=1 Tax=Saccharopolyspora erythraea TaxID=1836 RepID=A0ABN1DBD9_SACER